MDGSKVAALTALKKLVDDRLGPEREELDAEMADMFEGQGVERAALRVGGEKVGELGVAYSPARFEVYDVEGMAETAPYLVREERRIAPEYMDAVLRHLETAFEPDVLDDMVETRLVPVEGWDKRLMWDADSACAINRETGEVVDGVAYVPRKVKRDRDGRIVTRVTGCKPEDVAPLLRAQFGAGGIMGLLEGGAQ